jgi:hypothetical protein
MNAWLFWVAVTPAAVGDPGPENVRELVRAEARCRGSECSKMSSTLAPARPLGTRASTD